MSNEGLKFDSGKPRWSLLPLAEIEAVVRVLTYGAQKYNDNNWQKLDKDKLFSAAMRHISAWRQGEIVDEETGEHHFAHAICELIFLMWHDNQ